MFQAFDAVCHHQMKHREESWKYDGQRGIFDELRGVSSGDETASNAWSFFIKQNDFRRRNQGCKKWAGFLSDFQTLMKH